jgi:hypothetical protein
MVAMLVMLERLEKRLEMASAVFPPPIFARTTSISWFCVPLSPPQENTSISGTNAFSGQD